MPARRRAAEPSFWEKVEKTDSCWLWTAGITSEGYGSFRSGLAHRFSYQLAKGSIPAGLELDHLCRVRTCVNPNHLEAVTHKENVRRGAAPMVILHRAKRCIRGHKITEETAYIRPDNGRKACRTCIRERKSSGKRIKCLDCGRATQAFSGLCRPCITSRRASGIAVPAIDPTARLRSEGDT